MPAAAAGLQAGSRGAAQPLRSSPPDLLVTSARAFAHVTIAIAGRSEAQPLFHELPHPPFPTQRLRSLHAADRASRGALVT